MKIKDSPEALFHHYILDGARRRREFKYMLGTILALVVLFVWADNVHQHPPVDKLGQIPSIVFVFIISQAAYYLIYTCYIGSKVLDVQQDIQEDLMEKNI